MNNMKYNAMEHDITFIAKQLIICRSTLNRTTVTQNFVANVLH